MKEITPKDLKFSVTKLWVNSKGRQVKRMPKTCLGCWVIVEASYQEIYYSECDLIGLVSPTLLEVVERVLINRIVEKINKRGKDV